MEIISSDVGVFDLNLPVARFGSKYKCAVCAPSKFVPPNGPYVNVISNSIGRAYTRESIFRCENWLVFFWSEKRLFCCGDNFMKNGMSINNGSTII